MLHPVWPSLYFWYFLGISSSPLWLLASIEMEFIKKSIPLVGVILRLTILFSWFLGNTVLSIIFLSSKDNPRTDHFFRGYECVGKTVGYAVILFGNIGLYYFSEKSIACMLTFLFLAFYWLCTLFYIQPCTDFGVLDFLVTASSSQALSLFGLDHMYSWFVIIACIAVAGLRYLLEPVEQPPKEANSGPVQLPPREANSGPVQLPPREANSGPVQLPPREANSGPVQLPRRSTQKVVLKMDLHDDKEKQKALKVVGLISGVDSIAIDTKDK